MDRPVKAGEVFATFVFDGKDCADMGVYSITNGGTYTVPIEPSFNDDVLSVPAYDGRYYYGTQYNSQQFQFEMFADDLTLSEYRNLRSWLSPRKIGKLIISDQPYKYYLVKVSSITPLGNYPRLDPYVINHNVPRELQIGEVIYTGKFSITFETVGSVYGYGLCYYRDDLIYDALNHYGLGVYAENYFYDSGLLYKDMAPSLKAILPNNAKDHPVTWYNPGTAPALPIIKLTVKNTLPKGSTLTIKNNTADSISIIDVSDLNGENTIDTETEIITDGQDKKHFNRFTCNRMEIGAEKDVIFIPESYTNTTPTGAYEDYSTFYVIEKEGETIVEINPLVCKVNQDMLNKYFCTNNNGGSKIIEVDEYNNSLVLNREPRTYPTARLDESGNIIPPVGFACSYTGAVNNESELPAEAKVGDVKSILIRTERGASFYDMYLFRYGKWEKTRLFTSPENFLSPEGQMETKYMIFGANIVGVDDITIDTNFGESEIEVSLLPKYL